MPVLASAVRRMLRRLPVAVVAAPRHSAQCQEGDQADLCEARAPPNHLGRYSHYRPAQFLLTVGYALKLTNYARRCGPLLYPGRKVEVRDGSKF
jgi:hypothetical protein